MALVQSVDLSQVSTHLRAWLDVAQPIQSAQADMFAPLMIETNSQADNVDLSSVAPPPGLTMQAPPGLELNALEIVDRTTLLVKNLPSTFNTATFAELLNEQGLKGCYDFLYVTAPGFGLVNLVSTHAAQCATKWLEGLSTCADELPLQIGCSDSQGLALLVEQHSAMQSVALDACRPMLFNRNGLRLHFPAPAQQAWAQWSWCAMQGSGGLEESCTVQQDGRRRGCRGGRGRHGKTIYADTSACSDCSTEDLASTHGSSVVGGDDFIDLIEEDDLVDLTGDDC